MDINRELELINLKLDKILSNHLTQSRGEIKTQGVEKTIDGLGRITIPKSIRKELGIEEGATAKVYRNNNKIILEII